MFLECRHLGFKYPHSENDVLHDISFQIKKPGFHALFGPSGVGKTSLARILSGEIKNFNGKMQAENKSVRLYTYNQERLPGWSSVERHVKKISSPAMKDIQNQLIDAFGLKECIGFKFSQLSLGQKNRINLIRYLLQEFDILIMDESLANVDEKLRETIILKIKALFPDRFFLYISHNLIEVSKFCDRILVLRDREKSPQTVMFRGLDIRNDNMTDKEKLEYTILEIMNAC